MKIIDVHAIVGVGFKPAPLRVLPMTDRAKDEPRRKPLRLREYDYATPGAYFVTVWAHGRTLEFGTIVDQTMRPNAVGRIVRDEAELARIREDIDNNPAVWHLDRENPETSPAIRPAAARSVSDETPEPRRRGWM